MKKQLKGGFTLVELIVVIIVLSILSTLWFVSYQWYSQDARDSKRKSDISNLTKQLELTKIQWDDIFTFVDNSVSTILENIQISGYVWSLELWTNYIAGNPVFENLGLSWDWFTDPLTGDDYKIWVTSLGNRYEVAAWIEANWEFSIYTEGTWLPRTSEESRAERDKIISNIFYMSGSTKNSILLEVNDVVRVWSGSINTYVIKKIYLDRIVLDKNISPTWDNIFLNNDETRHLIKKWDSDFAIDENLWNTHTPYDLEQ